MTIFYLAAVALIPLLAVWQGARDWATIGLLMACFGAAGVSGLLSLVRKKHRLAQHIVSIVLTAMAIAVFSRYASPLIVVPGFAATAATLLCFHYRLFVGVLATTLCVVAVVVPFLLEVAGVISPTFVYEDGALVILPNAADLVPVATTLTLMLIVVINVILPGAVMLYMRSNVLSAERRARLQSWQLEHLITDPAKT